MADGLAVTPGSGATVGAELIAGQYLQRIKIATGSLDTDGGDVTTGNPLPTAQQGTVIVACGTAGNLLATVTQSSSVTVVSGTAANLLSQVTGSLTHNNAAPAATQVGVLPALANASARTFTEGDQVLLSTDLAGNLRTNASFSGVVTVSSGTAANFLATVTQASSVTVISGTAANLLAQVSQGTATNLLASVVGTVGINTTVVVSCGTAGNLLSTVACGTAANLLAQVSQGTATNLNASVVGTVGINTTVVVSCGTAGNLLAQVSQGTATNLNASVVGTVGINTTVVVSCGTAGNLLTTVSCGTAANLLTTALLTPGTAMAGQIIAAPQISAYNGTASLTISYASISFTSSAGNTVISAVANKNIYVLGGLVIANAATNVQFWQNTTASTALTGVLCLAANAGFQLPMGPWPNFATTSTNQAVQLSSSVATTIGGWLTYVAF